MGQPVRVRAHDFPEKGAGRAEESNTIAATTTRTGLRVRAELDTGSYPTGETVSDEVMEYLPLVPRDWHGKWNYRLRSEPPAPPPEAPWPDPAFGRFPPMDRAPPWLGHPTLTGLEPAAFGALHDLYVEHVDAHPTAVLPGKRRAFGTGSRTLSSADRLTATLVTLRWRCRARGRSMISSTHRMRR